MHENKQQGQDAEKLALTYLLKHNLQLLQKNFCSRFGEIDLIMQDADTIVFVEVKQRNTSIDDAIESIIPSKQKKLIRAAQYYLSKIGHDIPCRFDAIAIDGNKQIQWLKNIITL